MDNPHRQVNYPVVILVDGSYPTHSYPLSIIDKAGFLIAADGAADSLTSKNIKPDLVIGDMDSVLLDEKNFNGAWIKSENQQNTDLEKAIDWCLQKNMKNVYLLGAAGERDDHYLASLLTMVGYMEVINILMITDFYTIQVLRGMKSFTSFPNQTISILPYDSNPVITTSGLKYSLKNECLPPSGRGVSNIAKSTSFSVETSGTIWVFLGHPT